MPAPAPSAASVGHDTLITVKVHYDGTTRRLKMPFKDMKAEVFPQKLLQLLKVPSDTDVIIERYSDSAASFVQLDSDNAAVYKQLSRAARAKLRLVISVTTVKNNPLPSPVSQESSDNSTEQQTPARNDYLDTVLSHPLPEVPSEESPDATPTGDGAANSTDNLPVQPSTTDTSAAEQTQYREFEKDDSPVAAHQSPAGLFCIDCNYCGQTVPNEHYHCSICHDGDYDLCLQCVASGISCPAEDHWLIKRCVKEGTVTNSTTEKIAPQNSKPKEEVKPKVVPQVAPEPITERSSSETLSPVLEVSAPAIAPAAISAPVQCDERICNACLKEYEESKMVTCVDCEDYDLCVNCLLENAHGHHPGHGFSLIQDRQFTLRSSVMSRCRPGRNQYHAAVCDGCDKQITGVRHKCLGCPDWDYCSDCVSTAPLAHPGHRFAPIYGALSEPCVSAEVHSGVFCDGPLCKNQASTCIVGPRYKCTVCHDTDFCAKCEALPTNMHNHTHPLIKFKTPVRHVSVSTVDQNVLNGQGNMLGDRVVQKSVSTQATAPCQPEITPAGDSEKAEEKSDAAKEIPAPILEQVTTPTIDTTSGYQAFFVNDAVADGTVMAPNKTFRQTWKLYNPGPLAWPAGTDVRFVGGDTMFNVDTMHPSSLRSVASAMESNKLTAPLEPEQTADFTVLLRSPSREGPANSYWRLKLPNGTPFGHRLWCDIRVQVGASEPEPQEFLPENEKQHEEPVIKEKQTTAEGTEETHETEQTGSRMIFPTLDKESPSIHEATASPHAAPSTAPSESNQTNELDYLTITDTMSMGDDEEVDGFLTDEEYDVLDASDQEYLEAKQSQ
jgi:next-to-BRCA1 protein 1